MNASSLMRTLIRISYTHTTYYYEIKTYHGYNDNQ